ncbi:hypothetical protein SH467x_001075 [Pirellulaceae bacterium SH467]
MATDPYSQPTNASRTVGSQRFRIGVIPATLLFFVAFVTAAYGAMIVPNILRDASDGYDVRYLISFSMAPASLFGISACCVCAGRYFMIGNLRHAFLFTFTSFMCVLALWCIISMWCR